MKAREPEASSQFRIQPSQGGAISGPMPVSLASPTPPLSIGKPDKVCPCCGGLLQGVLAALAAGGLLRKTLASRHCPRLSAKAVSWSSCVFLACPPRRSALSATLRSLVAGRNTWWPASLTSSAHVMERELPLKQTWSNWQSA